MAASLAVPKDRNNTYPNFFPAAQRDFAARIKRSVTPIYALANHEPVAKIEGPLNVRATAGETIRLYGAVSDPDGNLVSVSWCNFNKELIPGKVSILNPEKPGKHKSGYLKTLFPVKQFTLFFRQRITAHRLLPAINA